MIVIGVKRNTKRIPKQILQTGEKIEVLTSSDVGEFSIFILVTKFHSFFHPRLCPE